MSTVVRSMPVTEADRSLPAKLKFLEAVNGEKLRSVAEVRTNGWTDTSFTDAGLG